MKRLLQRFDFRSSAYERPTQNWICGHAARGMACRIGPDNRGRCRATFECRPRREGDRWICTRTNEAGGKCSDGPRPDGTCGRPIARCVPQRSLRARRGRAVAWVIVLTVGLLTLAQHGSNMEVAISPGPLSPAHGGAASCQSCHAAAEGGMAHWITAAVSGPGDARSENARCLNCHTLGEAAGRPHSVARETLTAWSEQAAMRPASAAAAPLGQSLARSLFGAPQDSSDTLACATCHKEHQGEAFESPRMSDDHCQSCHSVRFASFDAGHPEFDSYPFVRRTPINFDHASHFQRHFPKAGPEKSPETCMDCHTPDEDGALMLVEGFAETCATCHAAEIRGAGQVGPAGIAFIAVPGLDLFELRARGAAIGEWPEWAEARMTPFMQALLAGQEGFRKDMRRFESLDLLDLTDSSDADIAAVERMAWRVKELFYQLIESGVAGLNEPLSQALGQDLDRETLARVLAVIPVDVIRAAQAAWFPNLADELARRARGEAVAIPEGDPTVREEIAVGADPEAAGDASEGEDILSSLSGDLGAGVEADGPSGAADDILSEGGEDILSSGQDDILSEGGGDILSSGQDDILSEGGEDILSGGQDDILSEVGEDILSGGQDDILSGGQEGLSDTGELDILGFGESDSEDDAAASPEDIETARLPEIDPEEWAALGGWYRRDFALYYKPLGHGDPFVKTWLEVSGAAYGDTERHAVRGIFDLLADPNAPGRCAKCHSVDRNDAGALQVQWTATQPVPSTGRATRFSHTSHFSLLDDKGCRTCHTLDPDATYAQGYKDRDPTVFWSNFEAIERDTCVACHAEDKVADSCTTCHQYHVGRFATRFVPTAMK